MADGLIPARYIQALLSHVVRAPLSVVLAPVPQRLWFQLLQSFLSYLAQNRSCLDSSCTVDNE